MLHFGSLMGVFHLPLCGEFCCHFLFCSKFTDTCTLSTHSIPAIRLHTLGFLEGKLIIIDSAYRHVKKKVHPISIGAKHL